MLYIKVFQDENSGKPGSVLDNHLSRSMITHRFKPSPKGLRTTDMPYRDVAPSGVYKADMSPYRR